MRTIGESVNLSSRVKGLVLYLEKHWSKFSRSSPTLIILNAANVSKLRFMLYVICIWSQGQQCGTVYQVRRVLING